MRDKLDRDREKIVRIRELCVNIHEEPVRRRILTVCGLAEGIFDHLAQNPSQEQAVGRFFLYLERTVRVVEEYSRIAVDPMGRRLLRGEEEEFLRLLDQAEEAFRTGYRNILHNRIVEFRTMGRVLGRMMELAEIGK
jgi:5-bromo-4-chloroindolyl phosphate hydrolysis protein